MPQELDTSSIQDWTNYLAGSAAVNNPYLDFSSLTNNLKLTT